MVFSELSSAFFNQHDVDTGNVQQNSLDSITLGQLKAMVGSAPKPKVRPLRSSFLTSRRLTLGSK